MSASVGAAGTTPTDSTFDQALSPPALLARTR